MKESILLLLIAFTGTLFNSPSFYLPIRISDRKTVEDIRLTAIGGFGLPRKERPGVPAHLHTGIDIKRPSANYHDEPVFSIYPGTVISIRNDGPYAQIIIEHGGNHKFWTVYEHVAGIRPKLFETVDPGIPIARFMNKDELNKYGWQFDHFHLEILKVKPIRLKYDHTKPMRQYSTYGLICFTPEDLDRHYHNPVEFLKRKL